jgi:hypothetical protein
MNIKSYGSMMEQIGAAQQRLLDQASASGTAGAPDFGDTLQTQQGGTNGSAGSAAPANAVATTSNTANASGLGQTTGNVNQTEPKHHHGGHHGGGGMFGGSTLSALLGGQESMTGSTAPGTAQDTSETGQSELLSSIQGAVNKAISSYFGNQASATATSAAANALTA